MSLLHNTLYHKLKNKQLQQLILIIEFNGLCGMTFTDLFCSLHPNFLFKKDKTCLLQDICEKYDQSDPKIFNKRLQAAQTLLKKYESEIFEELL